MIKIIYPVVNIEFKVISVILSFAIIFFFSVSEPSDQSLPNVTSLVICSRVEDHRILLDGKEVTVPSADTPVTPPQSRTSNWSPDVTDDENLISDL